MKSLVLTVFFAFPLQASFYTIIPHVLGPDDLRVIQQIPQQNESKWQWYQRHTFFQETYVAEATDENIIFIHEKELNCCLDPIARIFLNNLGIDIVNKRFAIEAYLDRNIVTPDNATSSGMFWHRDSIQINNKKEVADYSMILLLTDPTDQWEGANLILQKGGHYSDALNYKWVHSDEPQITICLNLNDAIIFQNFDAGHAVTPLIPLTDAPIHRDVLIITAKEI